MTREQWETVRQANPGKKRYRTTETGQVTEWKWSTIGVPLYTRLWCVEGGLQWHKLDQEDLAMVMAQEWQKEQFTKQGKPKGNKRGLVDPRSL